MVRARTTLSALGPKSSPGRSVRISPTARIDLVERALQRRRPIHVRSQPAPEHTVERHNVLEPGQLR
jgi:hypothetical protein